MRALDAYFATMYILGKENEPQVGSEEQKKYLSRILVVNEELNNLPPYQDLPGIKSLDEITTRHHQVMLALSNMHVLEHDLQEFLAQSRFTISLVEAKAELRRAIQSLSSLAWAEIRKYYPLINEDTDELKQMRKHEQSERMEQYKEEVKHRVGNMKTAWKAAVEASLNSLNEAEPKNGFLKSLKEAHERATRWVEQWIENGDFSGPEFFVTDKRTIQNAHQLSTDIVRRQVIKRKLLDALRTIFWLAIEHEMSRSSQNMSSTTPTETLAQTFLTTLGEREQNNGPLNIDFVSEGEIGRDSTIQKRYNRIKQDVRRKAREACLSLTMSAYFMLATHSMTRKTHLSKHSIPIMSKQMKKHL